MHLSSCEWFGFQGRTWAVGGGWTAGESGVWAGWRAGLGTHQGQIDRDRLDGRRSERDGRRRWGRPWAERPAQQTHRAGTDTCRKETLTSTQSYLSWMGNIEIWRMICLAVCRSRIQSNIFPISLIDHIIAPGKACSCPQATPTKILEPIRYY